MNWWILVAMSVLPGGEGALARTATITVAVEEPEASADKLVGLVQEFGGYFVSRNTSQVVLKVPQDKGKALTAAALSQGLVLSRDENARDLSTVLLEKRTLLGSRQSVLERYFAVLANADANAVVQVEQQITSLIQQIETLKGEVKQMEHDLQYTVITVRFEFKKRRPPTRDGSSPFPWLNTVNLADVLEAYQ